jgi:hypothetical protein
MSLVTLADMKTFLGISGNTDDAFLTQQLNIVSEAVEGYCNRKFLQSTYTQTFYREDFPSEKIVKQITLYHFPITTITSADEYEDQDSLNSSIVAGAVSSYRIQKSTGLITANNCRFFENGPILQVEYTAGFLQADIPAVVQDAVMAIVQARYNRSKSGVDLNFGSDVQRISIPGAISIDFDYSLANNDRKSPFGNIIGNFMNVLDAYRSERAVVGEVRPSYVE